MSTWSELPEWRRLEALARTPEQRSNLRSWGVEIAEPPPTPAAIRPETAREYERRMLAARGIQVEQPTATELELQGRQNMLLHNIPELQAIRGVTGRERYDEIMKRLARWAKP